MAEQAASQFQWKVTVSGIDGYWDTFSGGDRSADTNPYYDGGATKPDIIAGRATHDNITLSRAYKRDRDGALHKRLRNAIGKRFTVSRIATTIDGNTSGGTNNVYSNAVLARVGEPEFDSNGDDVATYEVEFAVGSVS